MTDLAQPPDRFREEARAQLADERGSAAYDGVTQRLRTGRLAAWDELPDVEKLRERAYEIRMRTIDDLDRHLSAFRDQVEARGGQVHVCGTAEEARAAVVQIAQAAGATLVAKSKSMASEEIGLNGALEAEGMQVVETDLGEYIVQLAGGHPEHIIVPAIRQTAPEVAKLFEQVEGAPVSPELQELGNVARRQLAEVLRTADVGVTGANFAVSETGSICLVTNEGNAGLLTSVPRVHVALLGLERLVPTLDELAVLLQLLARSATGQRLTAYTRLVSGPAGPGETDGPEEFHVVVIDNGRSRLRETRYREMLACIRCGACINVCPVYRKSGGSAYGPVYSGPMGAVLVPLLARLEHAPSLPHASSLCGACTEACPVKIPLHELLLELRKDLVEERVTSGRERLAFVLWSFVWSRPLLYRLSTTLARFGQRFAPHVGPGRAWTSGRALVPLARRRFRDRR
ncbi:MAG TPA: LutB/LldF family L-lactate oxidation iron-sulfur protein [Gaiellaceae bacterium]|nr:LutB/LldF family L-lactate oxidation iron-sulfur protein [Gaiellaceae bacterium]